jgi:hypothetical protein
LAAETRPLRPRISKRLWPAACRCRCSCSARRLAEPESVVPGRCICEPTQAQSPIGKFTFGSQFASSANAASSTAAGLVLFAKPAQAQTPMGANSACRRSRSRSERRCRRRRRVALLTRLLTQRHSARRTMYTHRPCRTRRPSFRSSSVPQISEAHGSRTLSDVQLESLSSGSTLCFSLSTSDHRLSQSYSCLYSCECRRAQRAASCRIA